MGTEHLLADLNPAQREAVTTEAGPLCILAGAGSGKTRVLTRRIAYRVLSESADAQHVLALTFTRKAAGELRSRLQSLGVRDQVVAGTFHAVAYAQLRRRWADRGETAPTLLDRKVRIIAPLMGRFASSSAALQPADIASEIEWAKARMVAPGDYEVEARSAARVPPLGFAQMAAIYERYEAEKKKRGLVDFDDLLGYCAAALEHDTDFAAGQRWRFRHLFVDEFQDVNTVQFRLLKGWLGGRSDLCVVGDPNQAIYAWNGSDPTVLTEFPSRFPGSEVVRLDDNYRSTPQVLAVANAILDSGTADQSATAVRRGRLKAHAADGSVPTVRAYPNDVAEARGVAARLRHSHGPGRPWSRLAILTRTNAQAEVFEEALRAASIPFRTRGGGLMQQPEVKAALSALKHSPARVPFASRIADLEAMATDEAGTEERRLNLDNLVRLAREYATLDVQASLPGFMAWMAATVKGDEPDAGGDAVDIVTFHRAKGLEWDTVFVTGLEKGLVPIGHAADSPEAEAEERRLLYVALTRARESLHCSWSERRTFGARAVHRSPSPWLAIIEAACQALAEGGPSADWRSFIDRERASVRARSGGQPKILPTGNPDPAVFAALKEWRSRAARAANVPAYVIFHDTTLAAVAEAKPTNRAALLSIPGLGPVKADRYGEDVLAVIATQGKSA